MNNKKKIGLIILGIFLALILIEVTMRVSGFILLMSKDYRKQIVDRRDGDYCILCIGESTTYTGGNDSYPMQLERLLNAQSSKRRFKVVNEGATGANTAMILKNIHNSLKKYRPQIVVAMMGINDRILDIGFEDTDAQEKGPFFKNLRLYKFFKWRHAFAKSKANNAARVNIENSSDSEVIVRKDMKDNIGKALHLRERGEYAKAMELFMQEVKINPYDRNAWENLWSCYEDQERFEEAEGLFKRQLDMYPDSQFLYKLLAECYMCQRRFKEAAMIFERLLKNTDIDKEFFPYFEMGYCYEQTDGLLKRRRFYEQAVAGGIESADLYMELGDCYRREENYAATEEMYLKAIKLRGADSKFLGLLGSLYFGQGRRVEAELLFRKASKQRKKTYSNFTLFNFIRLQNILKEKGIKFICMQYPMRPVSELKDMFTEKNEIIFVDNERIFKDAIRSSRYEDYFTDNFAGDFGHGTQKGDYLIATNLAGIILNYSDQQDAGL